MKKHQVLILGGEKVGKYQILQRLLGEEFVREENLLKHKQNTFPLSVYTGDGNHISRQFLLGKRKEMKNYLGADRKIDIIHMPYFKEQIYEKKYERYASDTAYQICGYADLSIVLVCDKTNYSSLKVIYDLIDAFKYTISNSGCNVLLLVNKCDLKHLYEIEDGMILELKDELRKITSGKIMIKSISGKTSRINYQNMLGNLITPYSYPATFKNILFKYFDSNNKSDTIIKNNTLPAEIQDEYKVKYEDCADPVPSFNQFNAPN